MSILTQQFLRFTKPQLDIALQQACQSIDAVFKLSAPIISKSDQSEIFAYTINDKRYFIKRYFKTKGLASWLGFSRFRTETSNQLWFNQKNLPSATVVAYGEERFLLKTKRAVLITEAIPHTRDLADIAQHHAEKFKRVGWRKQLLSQCADILRFFHTNRFCHNDLHWRNILVQEAVDANTLQLYLIDCPSGRKLYWPLLDYKIRKDLANLDKFAPQHLSRTQRLRFFLAYRNHERLSQDDKGMIKDVLQHKQNRIKRKAKESRG